MSAADFAHGVNRGTAIGLEHAADALVRVQTVEELPAVIAELQRHAARIRQQSAHFDVPADTPTAPEPIAQEPRVSALSIDGVDCLEYTYVNRYLTCLPEGVARLQRVYVSSRFDVETGHGEPRMFITADGEVTDPVEFAAEVANATAVYAAISRL
ncbi:hypothetical protein [Gordonia malaquae]|uniref:hypothetical protein n=1 Tax=Gordonia malaquae TaxID=410332 RepID=UPI003015BB78